MTRIVAGQARGVRLTVPDAGTRPTSDRAREAVFSSIESMRGPWAGAHVLDLYAGSGACGLEAASRGAVRVDLVESSAAAVAVIEQNHRAVTASAPDSAIQVHRSTVQRWLAAVGREDGRPQVRYDVVFCDPPYATDDSEVAGVLSSLVSTATLAVGGLVVVERSARAAPWAFAEPMQLRWDRRYGEAHLWIAEADDRPTASDSVAPC